MSYTVVYQDELVADSMSDLAQILVDKPNLAPMSRCTVLNGSAGPGKIEAYRYQSNAWSKTYPDQATVDWLTQNSADISTLQTVMATKAPQSQVTTIQNNLNGLTLDNIVEGVTNKYYTATEKTKLAGIQAGATATTSADIIAAIRAGISNTTPARSLNTAFQIDTVKWAIVTYAVDVSISSLLLGSAQGSAYLEYADDSGFTTNVKL